MIKIIVFKNNTINLKNNFNNITKTKIPTKKINLLKIMKKMI